MNSTNGTMPGAGAQYPPFPNMSIWTVHPQLPGTATWQPPRGESSQPTLTANKTVWIVDPVTAEQPTLSPSTIASDIIIISGTTHGFTMSSNIIIVDGVTTITPESHSLSPPAMATPTPSPAPASTATSTLTLTSMPSPPVLPSPPSSSNTNPFTTSLIGVTSPTRAPTLPHPGTSSSGMGHSHPSDTLVTEIATTCRDTHGDTCLCHDNICISGLQTATASPPTTTSVASTPHHNNPATPTPLAAIITPCAFAGLLILLLILPCILRRVSPVASGKFNHLCPLDDLYRGIAATWAKLELTRNRNRDVRKRTVSAASGGTYPLSPGRVTMTSGATKSEREQHEQDMSMASSPGWGPGSGSEDAEGMGVLARWRTKRERKLVEAKQRQLREMGNWGGTVGEWDAEVDRARSMELKRVREEKRMGGWMRGVARAREVDGNNNRDSAVFGPN